MLCLLYAGFKKKYHCIFQKIYFFSKSSLYLPNITQYLPKYYSTYPKYYCVCPKYHCICPKYRCMVLNGPKGLNWSTIVQTHLKLFPKIIAVGPTADGVTVVKASILNDQKYWIYHHSLMILVY